MKMSALFHKQPDGYRETIEKGMAAVYQFEGPIWRGSGDFETEVQRLKKVLNEADAVVIGAGAGLSTAAGFIYSGPRFHHYFYDFEDQYGIRDMYSGGFYPFPDAETRWAWWSRCIYVNRYVDAPKPVYTALLNLVQGRDYFVITTNVDHQFQRAGFDKARLFYTQGDYGLFQDARGRVDETYDNEDWVMAAMAAQGFMKNKDGVFDVPEDGSLQMRLPKDLIPTCPDGSEAAMNLRSDDTFVEDDGWRRASAAYADFLKAHRRQKVVFLELGVGGNTPVIIKYPFWKMTAENPKAVYACVNLGEAYAPGKLQKQSAVIDGDIGEVMHALQ
jgi:NAD-dependent SIR2 family protein deacetylase